MSVAPKRVQPSEGILQVHAVLAAASGMSWGGAAGSRAFRGALKTADRVEPPPSRILVVESDPRARSLLETGLRGEGFDVFAVATLENPAALWDALNPLPALVIADVGAESAGFSLCARLRADLRTAEIPVLLLSSQADPSHWKLALGVGADDYFLKPLFVRDLLLLAKLKAGTGCSERFFEAHTDDLPLAGLLRALLGGMRSGQVELAEGGGRVVFKEGQILQAQHHGLEGRDALTRMLLLGEGDYVLSLGAGTVEGPMTLGCREFVAEVLPRVSLGRSLLPRALHLQTKLAVEFRRLVEVERELPQGIEGILRLADGHRTLAQIVLDSPAEAVTTLQVVSRLRQMGVLTPLALVPPSTAAVSRGAGAMALSLAQPPVEGLPSRIAGPREGVLLRSVPREDSAF